MGGEEISKKFAETAGLLSPEGLKKVSGTYSLVSATIGVGAEGKRRW